MPGKTDFDISNNQGTVRSSDRHSALVPKHITVAIIGMILNVLITYAIVDIAGWWYGLSLALAILTVPALTYQLNQCWVFMKKLP